jgi:hypothetical protein
MVAALYASTRMRYAGVLYLGYIAIVIGALCLFAGLHLVDSDWIMKRPTHARLIIGLAIHVTAILILHQKVVAFALL